MAINSTLTDYALSGLPNIKADLGLENKQQRDARLFATGQVQGQPFEGYRPGLKAIAQGAAQNIPSIIDNVRKLGVEKGLPMQTKSELFDQAIATYDGSPQSQIQTIQALTAIDPQWGAMMAQRLSENAGRQELQDLQIQKLEQDLNTPTEWKPMASLNPDGTMETVYVSPTGGVQNYKGELLEGDSRPKNMFSVNYAASSLKDMGMPDLEASFLEREMINKTFIRGAANAVSSLRSQPASNTFVAKIGSVWNGLKQNLEFVASVEGINTDLTSSERANVEKQLTELGIRGAEFRALMMNLAYQKAKAMQGTSDRISDTDLNNALIAIGGDVGDAASIEAILINNIEEVADSFGSDWDSAFGQESPIDAYDRLGVTDAFRTLGVSRSTDIPFQGR